MIRFFPEFNKLAADNFATRLTQTTKSDITNFVKKTEFDDKLKSFNKRVASHKTKHSLVENELKNNKHLIQVFLLVKTTFKMMENNLTYYFIQFTKLLQHFLALQTQSQNCPNFIWINNSMIKFQGS